MERFKKQEFNPKDHRKLEVAAKILRVLLFPIVFWVRLYCWVYDGEIEKLF